MRQKKRSFFVRCGALAFRSFTPEPCGRGLRSGPDVFADALVPPAGDRPGFFYVPTSLVRSASRQWGMALYVLRQAGAGLVGSPVLQKVAARGLAAMVIVVPNATVNRVLRLPGNACGTSISSIPPEAVGRVRLHAVHRDT